MGTFLSLSRDFFTVRSSVVKRQNFVTFVFLKDSLFYGAFGSMVMGRLYAEIVVRNEHVKPFIFFVAQWYCMDVAWILLEIFN